MNRVLPIAVLAMAAALLAGCGKKPSFVDAPPGAEAKAFPRMYPTPASEGGAKGRTYPGAESEGRLPFPIFPEASTDPFARVYPTQATGQGE